MMSSRSMLGGLAALAVVLLASPLSGSRYSRRNARCRRAVSEDAAGRAAAQVKIPFDAEKRTAWHYVPSVSLESQVGDVDCR